MSRWLPRGHVVFHWGDLFVCEPDWSWEVARLSHLDLWYVIEGLGWIEGPRAQTSIHAGTCLLLRPDNSYRAGHDPERPLRFIAAHFDLLSDNGTSLEIPSGKLPPLSRQIENPTLVEDLLKRAVACHRDGCLQWAHAWFQAVWMEVVRQDVQTRPRGLEGDQARAIERICEKIRAHPERRPRVDDLAAELCVSPEHFCRLFRRFQGTSPRQFIIKSRIEAAQSLLLTSSYPIARVAELLGYDNPFYFSLQFKDKVGLAPRAFRNRQRKSHRSGSC